MKGLSFIFDKKKLNSNRTIYKENKNFTITILSFNVTTNFLFYFVVKLRKETND